MGTQDFAIDARIAGVPLIDERGIDFVSARVGNYQLHPYGGIIADQLLLR